MKKTFKLMGNFLLVLFLIFGVVSCDNPSTPGNPPLEIPEAKPGETVTTGVIDAPSTNKDGNVVVECTDENGGKYVFTQTTVAQRSVTAGGTWEYIVNGNVKFSGTYSGDITITTELGSLKLTIKKASDDNGALKEVKSEVTFEFIVSSDSKIFVAIIPVVEIKEEIGEESKEEIEEEIKEEIEEEKPADENTNETEKTFTYSDFVGEDVKVAFDEVLKSVEKVPSTDEEVQAFIEAVVNECIESFSTSTANRSVVPVGDKLVTATEIIAKTKEIYWKLSDEFDKFINLEDDEWKQYKLDFDEKINIGKVSFSDWFDIIVDFTVQIDEEMVEKDYEGLGVGTADDFKLSIANSLGLTVDNLNDYIKLLDEYVSVEQLYLALDADLNFEYIAYCDSANNYTDVPADKENTLLGSVYADVLVSLGVTDVAGLITDLMEMALKQELENFVLPIKAVAAKASIELDAKMTYDDLKKTPMDGSSVSMTEFLYGLNYDVEMAVCTNDKVGGIVSISYGLTYDKDNLNQILQLINGNTEILDTIFEPKLKFVISDGNKTKYSKEYKIQDLQTLFSDLIPSDM